MIFFQERNDRPKAHRYLRPVAKDVAPNPLMMLLNCPVSETELEVRGKKYNIFRFFLFLYRLNGFKNLQIGMVKVITLLCELNEVKTSKNMGRFGVHYPGLLFSVLNNILDESKAVKKRLMHLKRQNV